MIFLRFWWNQEFQAFRAKSLLYQNSAWHRICWIIVGMFNFISQFLMFEKCYFSVDPDGELCMWSTQLFWMHCICDKILCFEDGWIACNGWCLTQFLLCLVSWFMAAILCNYVLIKILQPKVKLGKSIKAIGKVFIFRFSYFLSQNFNSKFWLFNSKFWIFCYTKLLSRNFEI